jgi:hypothetical protein
LKAPLKAMTIRIADSSLDILAGLILSLCLLSVPSGFSHLRDECSRP